MYSESATHLGGWAWRAADEYCGVGRDVAQEVESTVMAGHGRGPAVVAWQCDRQCYHSFCTIIICTSLLLSSHLQPELRESRRQPEKPSCTVNNGGGGTEHIGAAKFLCYFAQLGHPFLLHWIEAGLARPSRTRRARSRPIQPG